MQVHLILQPLLNPLVRPNPFYYVALVTKVFANQASFLYHLPYPSRTYNHDHVHGSSHMGQDYICPSSRTWPSIPTPVSIQRLVSTFPSFSPCRACNVKMVACQAAC